MQAALDAVDRDALLRFERAAVDVDAKTPEDQAKDEIMDACKALPPPAQQGSYKGFRAHVARWSRVVGLSGARATPTDACGSGVPHVVLSTDPGQDPDDHIAMIILAALHKRNQICLAAVVATLVPAWKRARLARGLLNQLGLQSVPVGIGSDGGVDDPNKRNDKLLDPGDDGDYYSYVADTPGEVSVNGIVLMKQTISAIKARDANAHVTLLCIGSMTDPNRLLEKHPELLTDGEITEIILMGGAKVQDGKRGPDGAANYNFDKLVSHSGAFRAHRPGTHTRPSFRPNLCAGG